MRIIIMWFSARLIEDWKQAWKWVSVNCMAAALAVQGAWLFIPDDMRSSLPPDLVKKITIALLIVGIIGRLFKQKDTCDQKGCNNDPDKLD